MQECSGWGSKCNLIEEKEKGKEEETGQGFFLFQSSYCFFFLYLFFSDQHWFWFVLVGKLLLHYNSGIVGQLNSMIFKSQIDAFQIMDSFTFYAFTFSNAVLKGAKRLWCSIFFIFLAFISYCEHLLGSIWKNADDLIWSKLNCFAQHRLLHWCVLATAAYL